MKQLSKIYLILYIYDAEILGNFAWTNQSTKLLLQKYYERQSKFCDPKIKKKLLWTEIVDEFKIKGYNVSEDILDRKMRNLKQSYKSIKENNRKSSTGLDRITWKWYDTMDTLFKEDRIVNVSLKIKSNLNNSIDVIYITNELFLASFFGLFSVFLFSFFPLHYLSNLFSVDLISFTYI